MPCCIFLHYLSLSFTLAIGPWLCCSPIFRGMLHVLFLLTLIIIFYNSVTLVIIIFNKWRYKVHECKQTYFILLIHIWNPSFMIFARVEKSNMAKTFFHSTTNVCRHRWQMVCENFGTILETSIYYNVCYWSTAFSVRLHITKLTWRNNPWLTESVDKSMAAWILSYLPNCICVLDAYL